MKNYAIANIFYEIADAYEIKGVNWKPRAYRRAAKKLESTSRDVEELYKQKKLDSIKGLGKATREKIVEYINTGKIKKHQELLKEISRGLITVKRLSGLGPAKTRTLREKLGIKNISELKQAAMKHEIKKLEGFGEKAEKGILQAIKQMAASQNRYRLDMALRGAENIISRLKPSKNFRRLQIAGSLRRRRSTIGDVDILAIAADAGQAAKSFTSMPDVKKIIRQGSKRCSVILDSGIRADLRLIAERSWGSALQYFTGSKEHNIEIRKIAIEKGYKLNEYGIFKNDRRLAGRSEEEVYRQLGLDYIEPELRENLGEIEAAGKNKLPGLISKKDIKGDLHVHTHWSDGDSSIEEMVKTAKRLGHKYIVISDHSASRAISGGLDSKRLKQQIKEVEKINKKIKGINVLIGTEVDILGDGSLDFPDKLLGGLDIVIASIHSGFKMGQEKITERIIRAIKNKHVSIIGHPTGRVINKRSGYRVDLSEIIRAAAGNKVALEINAAPDRLDLDYVWIKEAIAQGVKLAINTDAHSPRGMENMRFGLAQARRGWAEKKDILNCYTYGQLKKWLDK